jgi:hypothetical protein
MSTPTQPVAPAISRKLSNTRYATRSDIAQLTKAIDRVRNDSTRYLICMIVDIITEQIASQEQGEGETCDKDVSVN